MLRAALRRAFVTVPTVSPIRTSQGRVTSPVSLQAIRFQSDEAKALREQIHEARNDLRRDWDAKELTYEELKPRTQQPSPDAYIVDVREPDEVLQGSIPSAVNVPLSVLAESFHLNHTDFEKKFGFAKPRQDQELVFYCRSGKRSTTACDVAKRNGYKNILNYKGSWLDWIQREGTPGQAPPAQP
ncbi:unnamed protein product [Somion occarium]|uniref:Rhodanese domain-containing protein n=1 Tax=Somion occarium TaxID=3059160 RepID=A0ABP1CLE8_9APHY